MTEKTSGRGRSTGGSDGLMKAVQLRAMPEEDLLTRVDDLRESLFNLSVRATTKELTNTSQLRIERRELARTLTVLREKGLKV